MLRSIFGVTGLIVWIVVILGVFVLLRNKNQTLFKSDSNRILGGVCGGIGECLNIDPTIIRLIWVIVTIAGGSGILAYIIALLIMPRRGR